jgi:hypothetical protein
MQVFTCDNEEFMSKFMGSVVFVFTDQYSPIEKILTIEIERDEDGRLYPERFIKNRSISDKGRGATSGGVAHFTYASINHIIKHGMIDSVVHYDPDSLEMSDAFNFINTSISRSAKESYNIARKIVGYVDPKTGFASTKNTRMAASEHASTNSISINASCEGIEYTVNIEFPSRNNPFITVNGTKMSPESFVRKQ